MALFKEKITTTKKYSHLPVHPLISMAISTLNERLSWFKNPFQHILLIGKLSGLLYQNTNLLKQSNADFTPVESEYDCVISFFDLETVNNVAMYLKNIYAILKPGGFFTAVFLGGESFLNLKNALMNLELTMGLPVCLRVHPTIHIADAVSLLYQAGFACPLADIDKHEYKFDNIYSLIHELRKYDATLDLVENSKPMAQDMAKKLLTDNQPFCEKFDFIYLTGLKPQAQNIINHTGHIQVRSATHVKFFRTGEVVKNTQI